MNNVHFNSFREHMIGQPLKGDRDTLSSLNVDQIREYYTTNYFGDNIVVVGTGNVRHQDLVDQVEQSFSVLPKQTSGLRKGTEKPIYIPALLHIRDDEMVNSNVGVFYDAPSANHEDYYAFLMFKHIVGNYRLQKNSEHINDPTKQYNGIHTILAHLPDVTIQDGEYFAYSDCGLWGNYYFGNEVFTRMMNHCGVAGPTIWCSLVNNVEVVRGRNHLYVSLMNGAEDSEITMKEIGNQLLTVGRRVPRSEIAKRVAHIDQYHLEHLAHQWFYDAEPSFTNWGPVEGV